MSDATIDRALALAERAVEEIAEQRKAREAMYQLASELLDRVSLYAAALQELEELDAATNTQFIRAVHRIAHEALSHPPIKWKAP